MHISLLEGLYIRKSGMYLGWVNGRQMQAGAHFTNVDPL